MKPDGALGRLCGEIRRRVAQPYRHVQPPFYKNPRADLAANMNRQPFIFKSRL
jgi:hypothetical protein